MRARIIGDTLQHPRRVCRSETVLTFNESRYGSIGISTCSNQKKGEKERKKKIDGREYKTRSIDGRVEIVW